MSVRSAFGLTVERQADQTVMTHDFNSLDMLTRRASQLHALLASISGAGGESFHSMADALKDDLIWLALDMSAEVSLLARTSIIGQESVDNVTALAIKAAYGKRGVSHG